MFVSSLYLVIILQEGDYEMKHVDKVGTQSFNVAIAPFALSTFGDDVTAV